MRKKFRFALMLVAMLGPWAAGAQQLADYSVSVDAEEYGSIASAANLLSNVDGDAGSQTVTLPFTFAYGETTYAQGTTLTVRADGYIYFGSNTPGDNAGSAWTTTSTQYSAIAPLMIADGKIAANGATSGAYSLATVDDNGDSMLVIEFKSLKYYYGDACSYNFQLRLHAGGDISAVYGTSTSATSTSVKHNFMMVNGTADKVCLTGSWSEPVMSSPSSLPNLTPLPEAGTVVRYSRPTNFCPRPTGLAVSNITGTSVQLDWTAVEGAEGYLVRCGEVEEEVSSDETSFVIEGLTPSNPYVATVQTICGSEYTSAAVTINFFTTCENIALEEAYEESFESWGTNSADFSQCWDRLYANLSYGTFSATSTSSLPVISTTEAHTGTQSLRMYSYYYYDDYEYYEADDATVAFMPVFESDVRALKCTFWYKVPTYFASVRLAVGVSSTVADTSTFTRLMTIAPADGDWHQYELDLSTYTGANNRITFYQENYYDTYNYVYGYIDDIHVEQVNTECTRPASVSVTALDTTTATVVWEDLGSEAGSYHIVWSDGTEDGTDSADVTNALTLEITGLDANTEYTVSVSRLCGDAYTEVRSTTFRTACTAVTNLPWSENFDSYEATNNAPLNLPCFGVLNEQVSSYGYHYPAIYNGYNHTNGNSTGNSLRFYTINANLPSSIVVLPNFAEEASNLTLSLYAQTSSSNCGIEVGYITNPTDASTFVATQSVTIPSDNVYRLYEFGLGSSATGFLAIRGNIGGNYGNIYIDDLVVNVTTSCQRPQSVSVAATTPTTATLAIADTNEHNNYHVVVTEGDSVVFDTNATSANVNVTGLAANTYYQVTVTSVCQENTETNPVTTSFRTECDAISDLPWVESFESHNVGEEPFCFSHITPSTSSSNVAQVYGSNGHTGSKCLRFNYVSGDNVLVFPIINAETSGLEISFWHHPESRSNSSCGTLKVGYITDPADPTTFVATASFAFSDFDNTDYRLDYATFENAPEGARIAFCHSGTGNPLNWYWHIDDIDVHQAPSCTRPSVSLTAAGSTEVTLAISDANQVGSYKIVIDGMDDLLVNDSVATISGLTPNTGYTAEVYTQCEDGTFSIPTSIAFRTECGAIDMPYSEDFDGWAAGQLDACWTTLGGTVQSYATSYGSSNLLLKFSGSTNNKVVMPLTAEEISTLQLTFKTRPEDNVQSCGSFDVGYVTNAADSSTFVAVESYIYSDFSGNAYQQKTVTFADAPAGSRIAFRHRPNATYYYWYVDEVSLDYAGDIPIPTPDPCDAPTAVNATVTESSVTLTWTATGDCQVALVSGNSWSEPAASSIVDVAAGTGSYTFDAQPATTYTVGVRQVCTESNSDWVTRTVTTDEQVGIDAVNATAAFELFPNPASGSVSIAGFEGQVTIVDLNGREVMTAQVGDSRASIDISSLPAGAYFVRLTGQQQTAVRKLIVK